MKRSTSVLLGIGLCLILAAVGSAIFLYRTINQEDWAKQSAWIYVRQGDSLQDVLDQLEATGGDVNGAGFRSLSLYYGLEKAIGKHSGAYYVKAGASAKTVISKIVRRQQDPVRLTFIGTRTVEELAGRIAEVVEADSVQVLDAMRDPDFLAECGCDVANVGSIFLPDTYEVYWTIAPEKLVRRLLAECHKFWTDERKALANALRLTPLQVSVICSIAEEETADRQERAVVARLYWNRLQKGMPLQADPTVKFALGDFMLRRILNRHLKVDSPYNTYRRTGLPPGPIRIVEKATIDAFLHSAPHKYLYMCAKEDFSGRHNFATNLIEHQRNAAKYHKALKANGF